MYLWAPSCLSVVAGVTHANHICTKLLGEVDLNGWGCAGLWKTILAREISCANLNPKPDSQSGSQVHKGLGTQDLRRIQDYDLETEVEIWLLTQPLTWEMGSSIFAATSRLKVASTTLASLPSTPSTDSKNGGKCFRFLWKCRPCLSFLVFTTNN